MTEPCRHVNAPKGAICNGSCSHCCSAERRMTRRRGQTLPWVEGFKK